MFLTVFGIFWGLDFPLVHFTRPTSPFALHLHFAMALQRSFLGTLNRDVRLLIRKTSTVPRTDDWRNGIAFETLKMLFDRNGPFLMEIGILFPMLNLTWG